MTNVNGCAQFSENRHIARVAKIAAGYLMTHAKKNLGDSAHSRSADADEVNCAEVFWHGLRKVWLNHEVTPRLDREHCFMQTPHLLST